MFVIDDATVTAIRQALAEGGELSAAVDLRRRFPGIPDAEAARRCVRAIVAWPEPRRPHCCKRSGNAPHRVFRRRRGRIRPWCSVAAWLSAAIPAAEVPVSIVRAAARRTTAQLVVMMKALAVDPVLTFRDVRCLVDWQRSLY